MKFRYAKPFRVKYKRPGTESIKPEAHTQALRDARGDLKGYVDTDNGRLYTASGSLSLPGSVAHALRRVLADEMGIRPSRSIQRLEDLNLAKWGKK